MPARVLPLVFATVTFALAATGCRCGVSGGAGAPEPTPTSTVEADAALRPSGSPINRLRVGARLNPRILRAVQQDQGAQPVTDAGAD